MSKYRCDMDGQVAQYHFGPHAGNTQFHVEATSLAKAVRAFRVGALFPHQYSDKRIVSDQPHKRYYLSSEPGGAVPVYVTKESESWVEVARIPPEAPAEDEFSLEILPPAARMQLQLGAEDTEETAIATAGPNTGIVSMRRHELEQRQTELDAALADLEMQKRAMQAQVAAMQAELKQRMERIWFIELFLGSKEEVIALRNGAPAPADTPITVRQAVLCMDEEIAVHDWLNNPDRIGEFDYRDVSDFDRWLLDDPTAIDAVLPWEKGVVALRVRRRTKDRPHSTGISGAFQKVAEEAADRMVYLLVRNGQQLYRLWADVTLWPRFFPSQKDYDGLAGGGDSFSSFDRRDAKRRMKTYFAGLLVLQGLIERSDLFHPLPAPGINVFSQADTEAYFQLVRDDEGVKYLVDGSDDLAHLSWYNYDKWLQGKLKIGARVMWTGSSSGGWGSDRDPLYDRTGIHSVSNWPSRSKIYTAEHSSCWIGDYSFLYLPSDPIYSSESWEGHSRKRRVRFGFCSDEVLVVDYISWRVLEHLIRDRSQRSSYGEFFRKAFDWWRIKKQETEREKPFVDLVLQRCDTDLDNERQRARCERLVRWWKLKTKAHRDLGTDEAKALRMVEKAFRKGDDHDDDPEKALLETMR